MTLISQLPLLVSIMVVDKWGESDLAHMWMHIFSHLMHIFSRQRCGCPPLREPNTSSNWFFFCNTLIYIVRFFCGPSHIDIRLGFRQRGDLMML
jgi:hypothetical protein